MAGSIAFLPPYAQEEKKKHQDKAIIETRWVTQVLVPDKEC